MSTGGNWEILKCNSGYIINDQYPHQIREISSHMVCGEIKDCYWPIVEIYSNGYINVYIDNKITGKHRLIAEQWIKNDDPNSKKFVDHINRIRDDNRIDNLRWVSHSENMRNCVKKNSQYIQDLPRSAVRIDSYGNIDLDRYLYDPIEEILYMETALKDYPWKIVEPRVNGNGLLISLIDVEGKRWNRSWYKFVREMKDII